MMPPKKKAKKSAKVATNMSSSSAEESDTERQRKISAKKRNRNFPPIEQAADLSDDARGDNDVYDENDETYMKLANDVVNKNRLPALFDPSIFPGFSTLISHTSKVSTASRVLEASSKIFGKRVDVVHTEARKLDHDVATRVLQDEKQKKKSSQTNDEVSLSEPENESNEPNFFAEEEKTITKKKRKQQEMNANMTQTDYDFNGDVSISATLDSSLNCSLDGDDLKKRLMAVAKDRTVLMGSQHRSTDEIEKILKRANGDAMEFYRTEMLKRGGCVGKNAKNEKDAEKGDEKETSKDEYSYFHNSYYKYALDKKREKRHVCIDDVAATSIDCSRIYIHNEWRDEENEEEPLPPENEDDAENGPDDGDFLYYPDNLLPQDDNIDVDVENDVDILDGVLEQFQGTLELATANTHKLESQWVELFGLERKDLRPTNNADVSFEQTANDDFDPDKRLVDRLVIEGEDEAMKAEEDRIEKIIQEMYSGRIPLPGSPGHPNEISLYRNIMSPPVVKMYQDEDVFFPFDQAKHITRESVDSQIAVSRSYFFKRTNVKYAKAFGIPDELFQALQQRDLSFTPLPHDFAEVVQSLPNYSFIKFLLTSAISKFEYNQECQLLSSSIIPFRMARYCEQLLNSVIHQVQSINIKPEFFEYRSSCSQSTQTRSQLYSTPRKKLRLDETILSSETNKYFAALELEKAQRYPNQVFNMNGDTQIYKVVSSALSSERGASAFLKERINIYWSPQAVYNLLAFMKFYDENCDVNFADLSLVPKLSELSLNDFEDLPSIENNSAEHDLLLENLNILSAVVAPDAPAPMEVDEVFDHDFDFQDVPSSPFKGDNQAAASSSSPRHALESQDVFGGSDNDIGDGCDDADDYDTNVFDAGQPKSTTETLDDSLAEIVRSSEGQVAPIILTRPKRNAKKIHFVDDDAHWEQAANTTRKSIKKKTAFREELEIQRDDNLLFTPRETFARRTLRPHTRSVSLALRMDVSPRMSRCQDSDYPAKVSNNKFTFRFELGQTIPGYTDPDKVFFCVRFSEHMRRAFQPHSVLYRGQYSFLPLFSETRQEDDIFFWLNIYRLCSDLTAKKEEVKAQKSLEAAAIAALNVDISDHMDYGGISDDEYQDAIDHDFDAPDGPSSPLPPPTDNQPRISTHHAGSLMGEYQQHHDGDDDDDDEIDDFDFESNRNKVVTLHYSDGKFALKRAIKYILTNQRYDRSTLPDEISGIKAPPTEITDELVQTQKLPHSTPKAMKMAGRFQFNFEEEGEEEIVGGDNLLNGMDDDEESDYENDTDETRMKNFKVSGFHTLKSLLFYLPDVCHPDTVRVLSVAHVFCTLCHMANENNLNLIQEVIVLDGGESTSDCRIMNMEDVESPENEDFVDGEMDVGEEMDFNEAEDFDEDGNEDF